MNTFSIALFLHIVSALGVSVALGLEWLGLSQIKKDSAPEEIRALLGVVNRTNRFGFISMTGTVITGIYMILAALGWIPWILVVIGALILVIVFTRVLTAPRMAAIGRALATEKGPVSQAFHTLVNDPILWVSIQTRVAIILGIIFLKIAKPDLPGSLLTIGIAIALGIASTLPATRRERSHVGFTD